MRKSTFNYIKDILSDYYQTDGYIKKREEELRYPYYESDLNRGIRSSGTKYDHQDQLMITIEEDKRLSILERNKKIVATVFEEADQETQTIIHELYMVKRVKYTLDGLIQNGKIFCSKRTAQRLRNDFFQKIADELYLWI